MAKQHFLSEFVISIQYKNVSKIQSCFSTPKTRISLTFEITGFGEKQFPVLLQ